MVAPGRTLDHKYKLGRVLHEGARGLVVEAIHVDLQEPVAIKILAADKADPRFSARLLREARQAIRIRSEHVVRYLDIGHLADGRPYVVMERLAGQPLSQRLEAGPLHVAEAADMLLQTCEALASAHVQAILHRDLRTSNLFRLARRDGVPTIKVLNFGNARAAHASGDQEDEGLTVASLALDAPEYKAPEQIASARNLDVRADIWSLGVIFYELLTGRHPFAAPAMQETIRRVLGGEIFQPPEITAGPWSVIARCLRPRREERWADVGQFSAAIAEAVPSPTAQARAARVQQILAAPPPAETAESEMPDEPPTVVRELVGPAEATANPSTASRRDSRSGPSMTAASAKLPRIDDGRTGARSFPWLRAPSIREKEPKASDQSVWKSLPVLAALTLFFVVVFTLLKEIVVEVHVSPRDTAASSGRPHPAAGGPTVEPAPSPPVSAAVPVSENEPAAEPPPPEAKPTRATAPRTERRTVPPTSSKPKAAPSKDPWGWER